MLNLEAILVPSKLSDGRRRDSNQIKYEILMAALPGGRKTHIMYESGLNLKQLNLYFEELLAHGALEFRAQEKRYYTTEKGRAFARAYDNYRETLNMLDKQEHTLSQFFPSGMKKPVAAR